MRGLDRLPAALQGPDDAAPRTAKRSAVLALCADVGDDIEIVYTRRRDDMRHHPGQISMPGGRLDDDEEPEDGAVREASEEIGLDPASVTLLGRLSTFYLPPSRFWLTPVVARWDRPHELRREPGEVGEILHVRVSDLLDVDRLRAVHLSSLGWSWAWRLDDRHLLWGATGRVTEDLLGRLDAGWPPVPSPAHLDERRRVEPWRDQPAPVPRAIGWLPRLPVTEVGDALGYEDPRWAAAAAQVVGRLADGRRVVALQGEARAADASRLLVEALGRDAAVVSAHDAGAPRRLERLLRDGPVLAVDALTARGGPAPLQDPHAALVGVLRRHVPRVVSLDVPSGMHADRGLVGELVSADATISMGPPAPALLSAGMGVFTGDVVVISRDGAAVVERSADGWRE